LGSCLPKAVTEQYLKMSISSAAASTWSGSAPTGSCRRLEHTIRRITGCMYDGAFPRCQRVSARDGTERTQCHVADSDEGTWPPSLIRMTSPRIGRSRARGRRRLKVHMEEGVESPVNRPGWYPDPGQQPSRALLGGGALERPGQINAKSWHRPRRKSWVGAFPWASAQFWLLGSCWRIKRQYLATYGACAFDPISARACAGGSSIYPRR
jgi:hypothetical protein